jgi:hypothetical protein
LDMVIVALIPFSTGIEPLNAVGAR